MLIDKLLNKDNIYYFYCFIVISIEPIIDNKSIIDVSNIKRGKLVYIILPIVVICDVSDKLPSHTCEITKNSLEFNELYILSNTILKLLPIEYHCILKKLLGEKLLPRLIKNNIPIIVDKGTLFILLAVTSDILTFISINMNKNNMDTAPT